MCSYMTSCTVVPAVANDGVDVWLTHGITSHKSTLADTSQRVVSTSIYTASTLFITHDLVVPKALQLLIQNTGRRKFWIELGDTF